MLHLRPLPIFVALLFLVVVTTWASTVCPQSYGGGGGDGGSGFQFVVRCSSFADIAAKFTLEHASCSAALTPVVSLHRTHDDW